MSTKTPGLTGLRWIACLNVIVYHLNQLRSNANLSALDWSIYQYTEALAISVSFFFVIGGLYRSLPYWRTILLDEAMPGTKQTIIDRFFRIAPSYYVALIASFFLAIALGISWPDAIVRLLSGLTFLSWVHPSTIFPVDISGPLWYISYDIMGTLIVIGIMIFLTRIPKKLVAWGLVGSTTLLLALHFAFIHLPFPVGDWVAFAWFPTYNPFLFWLHFLLGAVVGGGYVLWEKKRYRRSFWYDVIAILCFIAILVFLWIVRDTPKFSHAWPHGPYHFPFVPGLMALALFALHHSVRIGHWLDNRPLSWIAKVSYGVYLWQAIVIVPLHIYLFNNKEQLPLGEWFMLVALAIPLSLGLGWLSYTYLEVGVSEWRRRRIEKQKESIEGILVSEKV